MTATDDQAYRVTLICRCGADYAVGFGATLKAADRAVMRFWRQGGHKPADIAERAVDRASADGSHYEPAAHEATA